MLAHMSARILELNLPSALVATMKDQGGTFTAAQAYDTGLSHAEIQRFREGRVLESVRRGVYALREGYSSLEGVAKHRVQAHAALLVLAAPTLSHETAAVWSELPLLRADLDQLHVTRPDIRASRMEAGIHHHPGALPPSHCREVDGVRITSYARTAVDIARVRSYAQGLAAVDSALRRGTRPEELRDVLFFCRAWAGARQASRAVADGDGRADNPGESLSRSVLIAGGVRPTDLQVPIADRDGLVGLADFGWLPLPVLGEFDGRGKYGDGPGAADVVWREKLREDRLRALGYEVVRWTWADLLNPPRLGAKVKLSLRRAAERAAIA